MSRASGGTDYTYSEMVPNPNYDPNQPSVESWRQGRDMANPLVPRGTPPPVANPNYRAGATATDAWREGRDLVNPTLPGPTHETVANPHYNPSASTADKFWGVNGNDVASQTMTRPVPWPYGAKKLGPGQRPNPPMPGDRIISKT